MPKFEATKEVVGMERPVLDTNTERMIAVTHVPVVKPDKYEKLCTVMKKVLQSGGNKLMDHEYAFFMPRDADGTTKGVVFAEYENAKTAAAALKAISGKKLDSAHILEAFPLSDFDKTRDLPDEFVPPEKVPFVANDRDFTWLDDEKILRGCEIFATHVRGDKNATSIGLFNPKKPSSPTTLFSKERWCPSGFCWSPQGTYFVAMTERGAVAFPVSGQSLAEKPKIKMECRNVSHVDFSPQERYAFTRNNTEKKLDLWDVARGDTKTMEPIATLTDAKDMFVFDSSERFCVRPADPETEEGKNGAIEVYNIEKKKRTFIKVPGMTVMSLSPRDPYVATYTPERPNQGAAITIIDITNGNTIRSQTLHKAISCQFFWHPSGNFLAAQVDSYMKGKKRVSCLTMFRMDERGCPTQIIDEATQCITTFAWEPGFGTRFAYSSTDAAETSANFRKKGNVSIYDMRCYGSKAIRLQLLEKKPSSKLSWAPQQGVLLMCDLTPPSGTIEFYDVASNKTLTTIQHFNTATTRVEWDPSGRFVSLVSASVSGSAGDAGYDIYSFTGCMLLHVVDMTLAQFLWRPRPPCPLDAKRVQKLRENLPKFREEFQREEQKESDKSAEDTARKLQADSDAFQKLMAKLLQQYDHDADKLRKIYNGYDPKDPERFVVEQTVTEVPIA